MAAHVSTMVGLGTPAPDFNLPNTNASIGNDFCRLDDFSESEVLLVAFICNHCPYVAYP